MKDILDSHTHTTASGHAYNTIYEMAQSASRKGLALLGISDHGPAMEGSASKHYFRSSRCKIALIVPHVPDDPVALMRHMGAIIYLCFIDNLSRPLIDQLHAAGYLVDGSVINSKERMKTALEIGCDMVESDTPDQAIAWYRELTEETERHA